MLSVGMFALFTNATIADAPNLNITNPDGAEYWRGVQTITWTASTTATTMGIGYTAIPGSWQNEILNGSGVNISDGSKDWNTSEVSSDGVYYIKLAADGSVDEGTSVAFSIDNTDPITTLATTTLPSSTTGWYNSTTGAPVITLTCNDPLIGGVASGCSNTTYAWYNATSSAPIGSSIPSTSTFVTVTPIHQGYNKIAYYSKDKAVDNGGLHNTETVKYAEFKVDTIAPDAPTGIVIAGDNYINASESNTATLFPVTGTAEPSSVVNISITDGTHTATYTANANSTTGEWSTAFAGPFFDDGTITVTANATDAAGNTGPDATKTAIKDTVAPVISGAPDLTAATDTGDSNSDNITKDNTPDYNVASCTAGNLVTIYAASSAKGTATCGSGGDVTVTTTTFTPDGTYNMSFTETDPAGDRKSTRLNSSHTDISRMPSSA